MFQKIVLIAFISLLISGCTSFGYEVRPFFSSKIDCGNGWRAMTQTLCDLDNRGY